MKVLIIAGLMMAQPVTYTADDTHAAIEQAAAARGVSHRLLDCMVRAESTYFPYAVGGAGEQGAVQLHPQGRLRDFYRRGYADPWSPYDAVDYLAAELAAGRASGTDGWYRSYRRCA